MPTSPTSIAPRVWGLASYLVATPEGHILINSDFEVNVQMIRASMESLGFKFGDIKILLISHAHSDHCAASAMIKRLTGAKYMVMEGDVDVVESGGKSDFHYLNGSRRSKDFLQFGMQEKVRTNRLAFGAVPVDARRQR